MAEGMRMEGISSCESQNLENMDPAPFKTKENFLGEGIWGAGITLGRPWLPFILWMPLKKSIYI